MTALDARAMDEARARQARLAKPAGALGVLEDLSVQLAGIAGCCPPPVPEPAAVAVFAADHGVVAAGVSAWPSEVTRAMVATMLGGGAAVSVLAGQVGARVVVVDVGVAGPLPDAPGLWRRRVAHGSADLSQGPALTAAQVAAALAVGAEVAEALVADGAGLLVTGEMGIGNTTAAAAVVAALTGAPAGSCVGRGAGADDAVLARKRAVVEAAVARLPAGASAEEVLAEVGGLEIAALAGFVRAGVAARRPVLVDGVIALAGALAAEAMSPGVVGGCIAGHRSVEPGAGVALAALGLRPLLDLDLRLGEGSGAVLAVPLVQAAARLLGGMATLDGAGVAVEGA